MNPYLIEPYNAYTHGKKRKKHWTEIMEEEALYHKMVQDQMLREQAQQAQQQIQNQANAPAGAGGVPPQSYFRESIEYAGFSISPTEGVAPALITFTNTTPTPEDDTFYWSFGSGSLTSTSTTPTPLTYTNVGTYTIQLQSTSSAGNMTTASTTITLTEPSITASFTITSGSDVGPTTVSFNGAVVQTSTTPATPIYQWKFWSGTTFIGTSASLSPSQVYQSGSFTASFNATNSFSTTSAAAVQQFILAGPTLTPTLTVTTNSLVSPLTASITASWTYDGAGTVTGSVYISGSKLKTPISLYNAGNSSPYQVEVNLLDSGSFTASFSVTESSYNTPVAATPVTWSASWWTLTPTLTVTTSSNEVPLTASLTASWTYDGNGTVTGSIYVSGSLLTSPIALYNAGTSSPYQVEINLLTTSSYTASFSVTESRYNNSVAATAYWSSSAA